MQTLSDIDNLAIPPVRIPTRANLILHLLREEIKHQTLTNSFDKLGMDTTMYATNLAGVVLALCGLENPSDQVFEWYFSKLNSYADENLHGELLLPELAFNLYTDLLIKIGK